MGVEELGSKPVGRKPCCEEPGREGAKAEMNQENEKNRPNHSVGNLNNTEELQTCSEGVKMGSGPKPRRSPLAAAGRQQGQGLIDNRGEGGHARSEHQGKRGVIVSANRGRRVRSRSSRGPGAK